MADLTLGLSVTRDGASSWIFRVEFPDGRVVYKEATAHLTGLPVAITTEEMAMNVLEAWVRERPQDWLADG